MSVTDNRLAVARALVEAAVQLHQINESARVLLWTAWYRETCELNGWPIPDWTHRISNTAIHLFRKHKPLIVRILDAEYAVFAFTVNNGIQRWLKHGQFPIEDERRTGAWYQSCVPSAMNPSAGFMFIPATCKEQLNHPFMVESLKRKGSSATTVFANSYKRIDTMHISGLLSNAQANELLGPMRSKANTIAHSERPLLMDETK